MFGLLDKPKTAPQPKKEIEIGIETDLMDYKKLAGELNYNPKEIYELELLNVLKKAHVPIYNYEEVHNYLKSQRPSRRHFYFWANLFIGRDFKDVATVATAKFDGNIQKYGDRYTKTIPIHILRRIKTLKDMDTSLGFFVSDFTYTNPDPFLLVVKGNAKAVIGHWDEPGFVGTPEVF